MKTFLLTYHAPAEILKRSQDTSAEDAAAAAEKSMQEWKDWAARCGEQLIDFGLPTTNGQALHTNGSLSHSDKDIVGYSLIKANDLEEVSVLLKGHPHLSWNDACTIEIHETMALP
ncbi:MAG: hypothetical protein SchgKO_15820 [Schleiferiaceae bacterium]